MQRRRKKKSEELEKKLDLIKTSELEESQNLIKILNHLFKLIRTHLK